MLRKTLFFLFFITCLNVYPAEPLQLCGCTHGGVFHNFLIVLGFLKECEEKKAPSFIVDFEDRGFFYDENRGPNWWEYYFEPICKKSFSFGTKRSYNKIETEKLFGGLVGNAEFFMSRKEAGELIEKYIKLKPAIQTEIDAFEKRHFKNKYIIGIHYRGTDKVTVVEGCSSPEAKPVTYKAISDQIDKVVDKRRKCKIFVATDEQGFLEYIKEKYGKMVVYQDATRSTNGNPIHYDPIHGKAKNNYLVGKEAIIDCLLLSRCSIILKTSSNLNLCSSYFNPEVPVISLSDRF